MKQAFFIFLIGAAAGAFGFYYLQEKHTPPHAAPQAAEAKPAAKTAQPAAPSLSERAREDARAAKDAVANKLVEWHLTPDEIGAELSRTGQVVRTKAQSAGESIAGATSNARIITVIKTKYALDNELSSRAIAVACENGQVTLRGNVTSTTLIAKAVGLALDTDGVANVTAQLAVVPDKN